MENKMKYMINIKKRKLNFLEKRKMGFENFVRAAQIEGKSNRIEQRITYLSGLSIRLAK